MGTIPMKQTTMMIEIVRNSSDRDGVMMVVMLVTMALMMLIHV